MRLHSEMVYRCITVRPMNLPALHDLSGESLASGTYSGISRLVVDKVGLERTRAEECESLTYNRALMGTR